jgi:hypothetical protein
MFRPQDLKIFVGYNYEYKKNNYQDELKLKNS